MKKILFTLVMLVSALNVNGRNYLTLGGGGFFQTNTESYEFYSKETYKCPMLKVNIGHFITPRQSLEADFGMEFPNVNDLSSFRIGINYVFNSIQYIFVKIGAGYKQYKYDDKYFGENRIVPGCDVKLGLGFNVDIDDHLGIIIGSDISNMLSWHVEYQNSLKNIAIEPYIGFRANF